MNSQYTTLTQAIERQRALQKLLGELKPEQRALIESEFDRLESDGYNTSKRAAWSSSY